MKTMTDSQVLARLNVLARKERATTLHLLLYLNEIERRQLFAPLGYSTMFAFLTRHLRYSESGAARRLRVARCFRKYPELVAMFRRREVNMSTVQAISDVLNSSNRLALIAAVRGKTRREMDVLVAAENPPVRVVDSIRPTRVRTRVETPPDGSPAYCQSGSGAQPNLVLSSPSEAPAEAVEEMRVIRFAATPEFEEKLQRVRSLLSTRHPNGVGLERAVDAALESFLDKHDPVRRHKRRADQTKRRESRKRPDQSSHSQPSKECAHSDIRTRSIPAQTRDEVSVRDVGCCTFKGLNGIRCGSRHNLQVDHIWPHALGGSAEPENLRLLCAKHNRLVAKQMFGERAVARTRGRSSSTKLDPNPPTVKVTTARPLPST